MELVHRRAAAQLGLHRWKERDESAWTGTACHGGLELAWIRHGSMSYRVGTRELVIPHGGVVVVGEGVEHRVHMQPGSLAESVHVGQATLARLREELDPRLLLESLEPGVVFAGREALQLGETFFS